MLYTVGLGFATIWIFNIVVLSPLLLSKSIRRLLSTSLFNHLGVNHLISSFIFSSGQFGLILLGIGVNGGSLHETEVFLWLMGSAIGVAILTTFIFGFGAPRWGGGNRTPTRVFPGVKSSCLASCGMYFAWESGLFCF
mgnify:CR=1 FL=1